jgi:hypothetical protein
MSKTDTLCGHGLELRWMSVDGILDEALNAYPGIAVVGMGYVPIGDCMLGSGDPYFLRLDGTEDPPLVRILHDMIDADGHALPEFHQDVLSHVSELVTRGRILRPAPPRRRRS